MPAKYWVLPLLALTVLASGAHGSARADQEQFVVIVNTSPAGSGPRPHDVICQTRTRTPPTSRCHSDDDAAAQTNLLICMASPL